MIPRSEWEEPGFRVAEHTSSGPHPFGLSTRVVVHYTAAARVPDGGDELAGYLAAMQRSYVSGRGYSVGYNWAVDRRGQVWEIRGTAHKCAANGNSRTNNDPAVLVLVDGAAPANNAQIGSVRQVVSMCEGLAGRALTVFGHRDVRATTCPGDGLYKQVQSGAFQPTDDEDDMEYLSNPQRLVDTRESGGVIQPGSPRRVEVPGTAAHVVVTAIAPSGRFVGPGWVKIAGGASEPATAILNVDGGELTANGSAPVGCPSRAVTIWVQHPAHVTVDLYAVKR